MDTGRNIISRKSSLSVAVLKALGVFGSAEGLAMLCGVVRTKLVALWIGAAGVGLFGLFNSVVEMLGALVQNGIRNCAVRNIAGADSRSDADTQVYVSRRTGRLVGLISGLLCAVLSPWLSYVSFGDYGYWWAFCWLGFSLYINAFAAIESGVLQGLHRFSGIASASVAGSLFALAVSVPVLYIWRLDGIIPVILAYSACIAASYWWQGAKSVSRPDDLSRRQCAAISRDMLRFSVFLTASGFVLWIVNYLLMSYINNRGGEAQMGYFQCGYTLIIRYMGVAFSAIGMEFYPRLSSAVQRGAKRTGVFVSHEISVMLCIVVPMGAMLAALAPLVVRVLYSGEFVAAVPYVCLAMASCGWRCVSWCMGYMVVAHGDGRIYMALETVSGIVCLVLCVAGYSLLGIAGLGLAFSLWYLVYMLGVYVVVHRRYGYVIPGSVSRLIVASTLALFAVVGMAMCGMMWMALITAAVVSAVSFCFLRRR